MKLVNINIFMHYIHKLNKLDKKNNLISPINQLVLLNLNSL